MLHEIGDEQEQAARTLGANWWQTFWRITLPGDSLGGQPTASSSRRRGRSGSSARSRSSRAGSAGQTADGAALGIAQAFGNFDQTGAYTASLVLALLARLDSCSQ